MTLIERKKLIVGTIEKLENKLVILQYCEADCDKSRHQREQEIEVLQGHLHGAHNILFTINKEELEQAA